MPNSAPNSLFTETKVHLTKREVEVLGLISQGFSSRDAADILFVGKRTVDFHLANVYSKLKVNNRVQALRAAAKHGIKV